MIDKPLLRGCARNLAGRVSYIEAGYKPKATEFGVMWLRHPRWDDESRKAADKAFGRWFNEAPPTHVKCRDKTENEWLDAFYR